MQICVVDKYHLVLTEWSANCQLISNTSLNDIMYNLENKMAAESNGPVQRNKKKLRKPKVSTISGVLEHDDSVTSVQI